MKNISFFIITALLLCGCLEEYKISTRINLDGSIERTITVRGDSSSLFDGRLKVPVDSNLWNISQKWEFETEGDTTSDKIYEYTASRTFSNFNELNQFLQPESDTAGTMRTNVRLYKKFRWFYTYFIFEDTYRANFHFQHIPLHEYMSNAEYSLFYDDDFIYVPELDSLIHINNLDYLPQLSHADSVRMDDLEERIYYKLSRWAGHNIFEELFILHKNLNLIDAKSLAEIERNKEGLYDRTKLDSVLEFNFDSKDIHTQYISEAFGYDEDSLMNKYPEHFSNFLLEMKNLGAELFDNTPIDNRIEMPGMLLRTNADSISNNSCFWIEYNDMRNFAKDYSFTCESRIVNKWAFVVTGILLGLLIGYLVFSLLIGRRRIKG